MSLFLFNSRILRYLSHDFLPIRQRREFHVFKALLQMIPGLEQRLMDEGGDEEILTIAELVCASSSIYCNISFTAPQQIQKGASGARSDDTKSLKGPSLIGSPPRVNHSTLPFLVTSKVIAGFITNGREHFFVLRVWTGNRRCMFIIFTKVQGVDFSLESKKGYRVGRWWSQATSGLFFYMQAFIMTRRIHGRVFSGAPSLYRLVPCLRIQYWI
jgi:hypothetical protein